MNTKKVDINNPEIAYAELIVKFGTDIAIRAFPYLGQTTLMGNIEALLAGSRVKPPWLFIPECVSPELKAYMDQALEDGRFAEAAGRELPFDIPEMEFDTFDGIRMCSEIRRLLQTPKARQAGVSGIAGELEQEAEGLGDLLIAGGYRNFRFRFGLQACENPPPALLEWTARELADLGVELDRLMETTKTEEGRRS